MVFLISNTFSRILLNGFYGEKCGKKLAENHIFTLRQLQLDFIDKLKAPFRAPSKSFLAS